MTNSTDKPTEEKKTKKTKAKGPLRLEAIIPVAIIFVLVFLYMTYFFDSHLRKGIEFAATTVHGAEVNVAAVKTSVLNGSFAMYGLQITDKNKPTRNLFQVEEMRFGLLWDALLRAKVVVNEATIKNIQALVPRKKPGYVVPPDDEKSETLAKLEQGVLDQAKEDFNANVLGDVANVVSGTDPSAQLDNIKAELKSDARIKELEAELKKKEQVWKQRIDNLPKSKELDDLVARAQKLKFKGNPLEIAKDVKELDKILKEADQKVKNFSKASKSLNSDVNAFNNSFKELEELAQQDIKDLQKRMKIPSLDAAEFSKGLFGRMFQDKVAGMRKYMAIAREYMPPKKTAEEKKPELIPPARGEGKDHKFPITTGYPLFWLKRASISSEPSQSDYSGALSGEITNVTSNPVLIRKPALLKLKGDFPKQQIYDLDALITIDHSTSEPYEKAKIKIGSYPVSQKKLSDSDDVKFIMRKAKGGADIEATLKNQQLHIAIKNAFTDVDYDIDAKSDLVKDVLTGVANGLPVLTVDALAHGKWSNMKWKIQSNMGDEIQKGFKREVDAKIAEANKKLKDYVDNRIKGEKEKLNKQFAAAKGKVTGELDKKKQELEKAKNQAKSQVNKQKKAANKGQKKEAEKKLKKLLGF